MASHLTKFIVLVPPLFAVAIIIRAITSAYIDSATVPAFAWLIVCHYCRPPKSMNPSSLLAFEIIAFSLTNFSSSLIFIFDFTLYPIISIFLLNVFPNMGSIEQSKLITDMMQNSDLISSAASKLLRKEIFLKV